MMKRIKLLKHAWRRFAVTALALCMLLPVLCACNGDKTPTPSTDTTSPTDGEEDGVTLNGVAIGQYEIRYAWRDKNREHSQAELIREAIRETFGVTLKVNADSKDGGAYVIMVGDSDRADTLTSATQSLADTDYTVTSEGNTVYVLAKTEYGCRMATEVLCNAVTAASESRAVTVAKGETLSYADKVLTTMTFNIHNWNTDYDHLQRILAAIRNGNMPDTIGFQEMSNLSGYAWIDKIMANEEFSSIYAWVGEDRADSTGERAAIFYRKDKFKLVESGTKWLYGSDSLGADTAGKLKISAYNRVYTYVVLERISDGTRFAHINTHLDLGTTAENREEVQVKQIAYILAMAKKLHEENGYTVVLTGDFNARPTTAAFKAITDAGFVWTETAAKQVVGKQVDDTYGYNDGVMNKNIDHIFILADAPYCEIYTICDQKISIRGDADYPSDHLPRIATYVVG